MSSQKISHSANQDIFTDLPNQRGLSTTIDEMITNPETNKKSIKEKTPYLLEIENNLDRALEKKNFY